jgi:hypothetical protein
MPETTPNYWPAILGTSIAVLWLINTGLSIGSSKQYDNYISRFIKFFNKKPIILPSLIGNALRVRDSFARTFFTAEISEIPKDRSHLLSSHLLTPSPLLRFP